MSLLQSVLKMRRQSTPPRHQTENATEHTAQAGAPDCPSQPAMLGEKLSERIMIITPNYNSGKKKKLKMKEVDYTG